MLTVTAPECTPTLALPTCVVLMVARLCPSANQREEKSHPDSAAEAISRYSRFASCSGSPDARATSSLVGKGVVCIGRGERVRGRRWFAKVRGERVRGRRWFA